MRWAWILGLVRVGLTTPSGFRSLAGLPESLGGWLRGLRVDAYLGQAAAFPRGSAFRPWGAAYGLAPEDGSGWMKRGAAAQRWGIPAGLPLIR
ncbi:hypothetical protein [Thermoflexus hugenholtzii]